MIVCIVAVEKSQGIGFNSSMPWPHLAGDMKWFKSRTINNVVVMGSTTWKSLSKALPNRINVVISSTLHVDANLTFTDPLEAIKELKERYSDKDIYIIGGQAVYDSVKELVDVYYVTEINADYTCDKFFDLNFVKQNYTIVDEMLSFKASEKTPAYSIKEYKK
jgi:dihydrofolate reductase